MSPFFTAVWPVLVAWIVLAGLDWYLTLVGARHYRKLKPAGDQAAESYELNPNFQKDIDARKWFSPKFILGLVYVVVVLWLAGLYVLYHPALSWIFQLLAGSFIIPRALVNIHHFENLAAYSRLSKLGNPPSVFDMPRLVSYWMWSVMMYGNAVLFLLLGLATGQPFLYGGTVGCLITGEHTRNWGKKAQKVTAPQAKAA